MTTHTKICLIMACWCISITLGLSQINKEQIKKIEANFLNNPSDVRNYQALSSLISNHYLQITTEERFKIRKLLTKNSVLPTIKICSLDEAGIPITIKGLVLSAKGDTLKNVKIFVFHTDSRGYYAPDDSINKRMNEADPRLFGCVRTDEKGHFEFSTIHPGTYPKKYNGRFIPQHIHLEIEHSGYQTFKIQMAFEDDPAMKDPYWRDWAKDLNFPVIHFVQENGLQVGTYNIILKK